MTQSQTDLQQDTQTIVVEPKKYNVFLLNDDYTSMEFVVNVLVYIFHHNQTDATKIMMDIHNNGKGLCGSYTFDIAQTKINQVHSKAKEDGFPLKATMEEEQ